MPRHSRVCPVLYGSEIVVDFQLKQQHFNSNNRAKATGHCKMNKGTIRLIERVQINHIVNPEA